MDKVKICLDPGHDKGYNPSPCGFGYYEGTQMYEYSLMLKEALERYPVEVIMTRKRVEDNPNLYERAHYGKGCDVLLSLHSNAVGSEVNEDVDYVRVYYPISGACKNLAVLLSETIAGTMQTKQEPQHLSRVNSKGTADYYGIIRHSAAMGMPALILEHSFHTNSRSTQWLMSDANLRKLAKAEAATVAQYYGLELVRKEENEMRYNTMADLKKDVNAEHYLPTIEKLLEKSVLAGKGGEGDDLILDLGEDAVRLLVVLDRQGVFGD